MAVPPSLLPSHSEKVLGAMKAKRTVRRIGGQARRDTLRQCAQAWWARGPRLGLAGPGL